MSHKRQDTFCKTTDWCKHLRPFMKRKQAKRERKAAAVRIRKEVETEK